jgi:hypothetical protein
MHARHITNGSRWQQQVLHYFSVTRQTFCRETVLAADALSLEQQPGARTAHLDFRVIIVLDAPHHNLQELLLESGQHLCEGRDVAVVDADERRAAVLDDKLDSVAAERVVQRHALATCTSKGPC